MRGAQGLVRPAELQIPAADYRFLEDILDWKVRFKSRADRLMKGLLNILRMTKTIFPKPARRRRISNSQGWFRPRTDGINLFEAAVAAAIPAP